MVQVGLYIATDTRAGTEHFQGDFEHTFYDLFLWECMGMDEKKYLSWSSYIFNTDMVLAHWSLYTVCWFVISTQENSYSISHLLGIVVNNS